MARLSSYIAAVLVLASVKIADAQVPPVHSGTTTEPGSPSSLPPLPSGTSPGTPVDYPSESVPTGPGGPSLETQPKANNDQAPANGAGVAFGKPACKGVNHVQLPRDLFQVGAPGQYIGPETGWTIMEPPFLPAPVASGELPPPQRPWKPLFFDNDFRYLEKPGNTIHNPFDFLKAQPFPE